MLQPRQLLAELVRQPASLVVHERGQRRRLVLEHRSALDDLAQLRLHAGLDLLIQLSAPYLGLLHEQARPLLGVAHQLRRFYLRLPSRRVGGSLGQDEGSAQVFVWSSLEQTSFCVRGPRARLRQPGFELVERLGHLLDERIDLIGPVSPPLLGEADLTDTLG